LHGLEHQREAEDRVAKTEVTTERRVEVAERRARLARRQLVAPAHRAATVEAATAGIVCLHGTDPATIYLSAWARVPDLEVADVDRALVDDRTLVKHLAMRRTIFVFPRAVLPAAQAGASAKVAGAERRRLIKDVETAGLHRDGNRWLDRAAKQVVELLADGREASSTELRADLPLLEGAITYGEGKSWGGKAPIGPRVLTVLSAEGRIVRATNDGPWTTSRPRWASMASWLGESLTAPAFADGHRELVERWLRAFGPGTEQDIQWWIGSTKTAVRASLAELDAVPVDLDGTVGYLLPDDLDVAEPVDPWVALLPPLDPTTMGWTDRAWYLGEHKAMLFDTAGNAGPTVWVDGRIVGGWRQDDHGAVELQLLEPLSRRAAKAIAAEAERLTAWLGGVRVMARFPSPLSKQVAGSP
jgi:hypothetical protein